MNLTPVQYVALSLNLIVQVFKKWSSQGGKLTKRQKESVLLIIEILTSQLFRCIADLSRELGEFGGEFEVPRVQNRCLEYECSYADNQSDSGDPLCKPGIPR